MNPFIARVGLVVFFAVRLVIAVIADPAQAQTVTATLGVGWNAQAVAVNPVTNNIYVPSSGLLSVVDGASNSVTTYPVSHAAGFPATVNPVTNQIYINSVYTIDNGFPEPVSAVAVFDGGNDSYSLVGSQAGWIVGGIAVNPVTNKIYVENGDGRFVGVIDGATNATASISVSTSAESGIDVDPVTNKIYVATPPNSLTVIDGATNAVTSTVPVGSGPLDVAVNPITNKIYVTNAQSNNVTVVDGATLETTTVPVGSGPLFIAVNPVTNKIYVANQDSNNITAIDGSTDAITTLTDPTASGPAGVAVDALTNQIYVANSGSGTVTAINGATNGITSVTLPNDSAPSPIALNPLTNTVYVLGPINPVDEVYGYLSIIAGVAGTGAPDFAMGATSASLMLSPGGQATDTIIVGPPYGNTVDLTCSVSGPSPAPACELSASSVTPGPTYGTATLTITAPTAAAMLAPSHHPRLGGFYAACVPLLFGIAIWGRSKRRRMSLSAGFLPVFLILLSSCGGGSPNGGGTGPQRYTVIVTGTSGTIQHSTQVTVTVQ